MVDVLTGKDAVIGILAALAARERTGRGQHVRVELLSSLLGGLVNQAAGYLTTGVAPGRMGNGTRRWCRTRRCGARTSRWPWRAVTTGSSRGWSRCSGCPTWPSTHASSPTATAWCIATSSIPALESRSVTRPAAEWEAELSGAGVPAGLVGDVGDAIARAQECELAPVLDARARAGRPDPAPGAVLRQCGRCRGAPPPGLGEHDVQLQAWLDGPADEPLPRRTV